MGRDKVYIISNESIFEDATNSFCDNLDMKSIPEGLSKYFDVNIIARKSKLKRFHSLNKMNIKTAGNIIVFLKLVLDSLKDKKKSKYLIISVTPFTFFAVIFLFTFKIKPMVYLRSDGYEEYKTIFGQTGKLIYHIMFSITAKISNLISCRKHILKKYDGKIVSPSQLKEEWFKNHKDTNKEKIKILYVGRIRIEKGIFSLIEISKKIKQDVQLTVISSKKDHDKIQNQKNIICLDTQSERSLIDEYDKCNIFILPSFTEGHPQVLDEALSRFRPVIVFKDIEHVKRDRKGVFVCNRNSEELSKTIDFIIDNYDDIQSEIKKNNLPDRKSFLSELKNLINLSNNKERWPSGVPKQN